MYMSTTIKILLGVDPPNKGKIQMPLAVANNTLKFICFFFGLRMENNICFEKEEQHHGQYQCIQGWNTRTQYNTGNLLLNQELLL